MNVVVVGGGPAGMIAGITSAEEGNNVILVEKNSSLGNKLKITGKVDVILHLMVMRKNLEII